MGMTPWLKNLGLKNVGLSAFPSPPRCALSGPPSPGDRLDPRKPSPPHTSPTLNKEDSVGQTVGTGLAKLRLGRCGKARHVTKLLGDFSHKSALGDSVAGGSCNLVTGGGLQVLKRRHRLFALTNTDVGI